MQAVREELARLAPGIPALIFAFAVALLGPVSASGQNASQNPESAPPRDSQEETSALDQFHGDVGRSVRELARHIDGFFSDAEFDSEQNTTSLRLRFEGDFEQPEEFGFDISPRLRLQLPGTAKSLLLEIEGESRSVDGDERLGSDGLLGDEDADDFELRLRYLRSFGDILLSPELGVGSDGGSPQVFGGGRIRNVWGLGGDWRLQLSERLRYYSDRGLDSVTNLQADTIVFGDDLFRTSFDVRWRDDKPGLDYGPGLRLFRRLGERTVIGLQGDARFKTEPSHVLDEVVGAIRYRRRVITEWSIIEVAPRIMFKHEDNYSPSFGAAVRLDLEF
jgi:hypothetical protein